MYNGFKKIVLGLLFIFLNFNINKFDIIPDFVGYILIISGLSMIAMLHPAFITAKLFAIVLCMYSIVDQFFKLSYTNTEGEIQYTLFNLVLSIISYGCSIGFNINLGKGMCDILIESGLTWEAERTRNCITLNVTVLIITFILTLPPLFAIAAFPVVLIPLLVIALIGGIWMMVRVSRNRTALESVNDNSI